MNDATNELKEMLDKLSREQLDKAVRDMIFEATTRAETIKEKFDAVMHIIQLHQPAGSPPPGDEIMLARWVLDVISEKPSAIANARAEVAEADALKTRLLLGRVYLALSRAVAEPTDTAELVEVMTLIEQIAGKPGSK